MYIFPKPSPNESEVVSYLYVCNEHKKNVLKKKKEKKQYDKPILIVLSSEYLSAFLIIIYIYIY